MDIVVQAQEKEYMSNITVSCLVCKLVVIVIVIHSYYNEFELNFIGVIRFGWLFLTSQILNYECVSRIPTLIHIKKKKDIDLIYSYLTNDIVSFSINYIIQLSQRLLFSNI